MSTAPSSKPQAPTAAEDLDPELRSEEDASGELIHIASEIRAWQLACSPRLSDVATVKQFPGLGSTKTYRRIREGELGDLRVAVHLAKYRGVQAQIETLGSARGAEEVYEDLTPALETTVAVGELIPRTEQNRLLLIEGPSGAGKTVSLRLAAGHYPGAVVTVEAHEGWTSPTCAVRDIVLAIKPSLKREDLPQAKAELLAILLNLLNEKKLMLCIDEGQHACAGVLNIIKTLINRTPVLIVIAAIGTLWRKLTTRSWEETCQLIHNRLHDRIVLRPPSKADVELFLTRRLPQLDADWKGAVPRIRDMAATSGHFAFLRDVTGRLQGGVEPVTAGDLLAAAADLKRTHEAR